MTPLQDFGEKIGGARKDLWKSRGLISADLNEMTDVERSALVKKENIWLKPDWAKLIADGTLQSIAYWQSKMRQAIPPRPPKTDPDSLSNYVTVIRGLRDAVMSVKTPRDLDRFYEDVMCKTYLTPESKYYRMVVPQASGIVNEKVLAVSRSNHNRLAREARDKLFGIPKNQQAYVSAKNNLEIYYYDGEDVTVGPDKYVPNNTLLAIDSSSGFGKRLCLLRNGESYSDPTEWEIGTYFVLRERPGKPLAINFENRQDAAAFIETYARDMQKTVDAERAEKGGKGSQTRKGPFIPPQLRKIQRTGPDYRHHRNANSRMFLDDLHFRGGEYGNWLNSADRQVSLNMAYDSLRDLARVLQIRPEDVSLNGSLAIAFGARGRGGANAGAAHYEPAHQVINLTKMSGAGCLAHEWGHALDHAFGISCGFSGLASEQKSYKLPEPFRDVLHALKRKTVLIPPAELAKEKAPEIDHCKKNLFAWIDGEKPKNLPPDLEKTWDSVTQKILSCAASFTGNEYLEARGSAVQTKPEIELLSQIRKTATGRAIPKKVKQQIVLWARDLKKHEAELSSSQPKERTVETDFYKGSVAFDKLYSRMAHGYWSSDCEMFARAFDCYVSDKLKAAGCRSDYLSAYADAYVMPDGKDGKIAAIPLGEEREQINALFDALLENLKERGLLKHYEESLSSPSKTRNPAAEKPPAGLLASRPMSTAGERGRKVRYEQMSFDDLFSSAQSRRQTPTKTETDQSQDLSR